MNADPLELLVNAYRAETSHRDRDAGALRARVLASATRRRRSCHRLVWLAAAAVVFVGSAAMAASGSESAARLVDWLRLEVGVGAKEASEVHKARSVPRAAARAPVQPSPPARVTEPVEPSHVVPLTALPMDEPGPETKQRPPVRRVSATAPPRAVPSPAAAAPPPAAVPSAASFPPAVAAPDLGPELTLYQRAHALHFGGGDPAQALDAWRLYLRSHPEGSLATEARLNAAVCLLKLGKRGEGRRVLESLATGSAPQSTKLQARELLLVLGANEPSAKP